jgi:hypothetical protein
MSDSRDSSGKYKKERKTTTSHICVIDVEQKYQKIVKLI